MPIKALASVSSTDSGSFDLFKVRDLVWTKKWSFIFVALTILLSASTKSLLSNVIAYEASNIVEGKATNVRLQSLVASLPNWIPFVTLSGRFNTYNFNPDQRANFSTQYLGMLTDLTFHAGADRLIDDHYVGINATTSSLDAVPKSVKSLSSVPGYRMAIDCKALTPTNVFFNSASNEGDVRLLLYANFDLDQSNKSDMSYAGSWTSGLQSAFGYGVGGDTRPFVGFQGQRPGDPRFDYGLYLGFIGTLPVLGGLNNSGVPSVYGELKYLYTNQSTSTQANNLPSAYYVWGVSCRVTRQTGFHTLERTDTGAWELVANSSRYNEDTDIPPLRISDWTTDLGYRAPLSHSMPGLGPVFSTTAASCQFWPNCSQGTFDGEDGYNNTFSFQKMAHNALYAIGETNRMLNELGMQNSSDQGMLQINGRLLEQRYHITYVPLIVFGGLLNCLMACLITFGFEMYLQSPWRKGGYSVRNWRKVDVVRLIADAVDGLRDEIDLYSLSRRNNTSIGTWSEAYNVRYVEGIDEAGIKIKLEKAD